MKKKHLDHETFIRCIEYYRAGYNSREITEMLGISTSEINQVMYSNTGEYGKLRQALGYSVITRGLSAREEALYSLSQKIAGYSEGYKINRNHKRPFVALYPNGQMKQFTNIRAAGQEIGADHTFVNKVLLGKYRACKGVVLMYLD